MYDVVVIGHGPAAVSAALYLKRANKTVALVGKDLGALEKAEKIENYFGLAAPVSGQELAQRGLRQAHSLGAEIIDDEVLDITWNNGFSVICKESEYSSKAVIISTGAARKTLPIEGLLEHEGKGVSYCAVCDAFFYRQKIVGVIGNGDYALHELNHLSNVVAKAYLFTNGQDVPAELPENAQAISEPPEKILGDSVVEGVLLKNGETIALSGVFVALGSASAADFARKLGAEIINGKISVDADMQTAVPGLYAAGDCTGGLLQVATAVSEGAKAAMSVINFLREGSGS